MSKTLWLLFASIASVFLISCSTPSSRNSAPEKSAPAADLIRGEQLFNQNCAACHGVRAAGTPQGPSFINTIYVPSHHADVAFVLAAQVGVKAHHWQFGDMPAQPQVGADDMRHIVAYVRLLQRQAGIK